MIEFKTLLDREQLSSDHIRSKQDFESVLSKVKQTDSAFWKQGWFYGAIGTASIALTVSIVSIDSISQTVSQTSPAVAQAENPAPVDSDRTTQNNTLYQKDPTNIIRSVVQSTSGPEPINRATQVSTETDRQLVVQEAVSLSKPKFLMAQISGVSVGQISGAQLCEAGILECNNDEYRITTFTIAYQQGGELTERSIKGNKIPQDVCNELAGRKNAEMIYFTQIHAKDQDGQTRTLPAMNLEIVNP